VARTHERLDDGLREWIGRQHVFFVATAPSGDEGHVNLSPKGYDTFRILDDHTVAYLDLTGSGVETISHLQQNGRITFLFCAFEGPPRIVRLYGQGRALRAGDDGFDELAEQFPSLPGTRSIIRVELDRISTSCGYSIPFLRYDGERERLLDWADKKGPEGLEEYWGEKNQHSIDGLPALGSDAGLTDAR
jgi:hypothetical protein